MLLNFRCDDRVKVMKTQWALFKKLNGKIGQIVKLIGKWEAVVEFEEESLRLNLAHLEVLDHAK